MDNMPADMSHCWLKGARAINCDPIFLHTRTYLFYDLATSWCTLCLISGSEWQAKRNTTKRMCLAEGRLKNVIKNQPEKPGCLTQKNIRNNGTHNARYENKLCHRTLQRSGRYEAFIILLAERLSCNISSPSAHAEKKHWSGGREWNKKMEVGLGGESRQKLCII